MEVNHRWAHSGFLRGEFDCPRVPQKSSWMSCLVVGDPVLSMAKYRNRQCRMRQVVPKQL